MKAGRWGLYLLFFLLVFSLSFLAFFPFGPGAEVAWSRAVRAASEKGFFLDASDVSADGRFLPEAVLLNVRLRSPILSGEAGRVTTAFSPRDAIISLAPAARLRLERVSVNLPVPGERPLFLAAVEARLVFPGDRVEVLELRTSGELDVSGTAVLSSRGFALEEADLTIGGERAALMELFRSVLPLRQEKPGAWILKRGGRNVHGGN